MTRLYYKRDRFNQRLGCLGSQKEIDATFPLSVASVMEETFFLGQGPGKGVLM